jgi:hypothetical protein
MHNIAYEREVFVQMATVGGVLAAISAALFVSLCTVENRKPVDRVLLPVIATSAISFVLGTVLAGMVSFAVILLADRPDVRPALERIAGVMGVAWALGFGSLLLGVALAGYRVSRALGTFALILAVAGGALFFYALNVLGTAFTQR